jgi:GNAT superfamily N-acetyltransferase
MFRDMGVLAEPLAGPLVEATVAYLTDALHAGEYVGWLAAPADHPAEIVAGAGLQLRRVLPHPVADGRELALGLQGIVLNVYTELVWRRRGLAGLLMRHLIAWAAERGVASLVLHAAPAARPLYEQLGFVPTNEMRYTGPLGARGLTTV